MIEFLRNIFGIIALVISAIFAFGAINSLSRIPRYKGWALFGLGINLLLTFSLFKLGDKLTTFEITSLKEMINE